MADEIMEIKSPNLTTFKHHPKNLCPEICRLWRSSLDISFSTDLSESGFHYDALSQPLVQLLDMLSFGRILFDLWRRMGDYYANYGSYEKFGSTIVGTVKFLGSVPTFWVSDGDALKIISNNRTTFRRDTDGYEVVSVYGPNMVATEGTEWKRHRAVSKPAFNEANNSLVWLHSTRIVHEWFSHLDSLGIGRKEIRIDLIKDFTEIALLILSSAAFGRHNSWGDHSVDDELAYTGHVHKIPFRPAVTSAVNNLVPKVLLPNWLLSFAKHVHIPIVGPILRETATSFDALRLHMLDMIAAARPWAMGGDSSSSMDAALLMNLVQANIAQTDDSHQKRRLTDEELLSNTFMFLLAGHETSAHTICFALCLLALWPDVQEKMFKEVERLWPDGNPPPDKSDAAAYQDIMNELPYTLAIFRETLRLFPPVPRVASPVSADTHLTGHRFSLSPDHHVSNTTKFDVAIPAQSIVVIDIISLHRNPIHWGNDATDFKPERFIDTADYQWPRHAFLAFSAGPRACMGERFATVESVCTLAHVIRRYKVSVPDEIKRKPRGEQIKHLMSWFPRMTLIPSNAYVNVTRRN